MPRTISPFTAAEYQALVNGVLKYCPKTIYSFAGQTYTAAQAVKVISTVLSAVSATANAKTALTDARQAEAAAVSQYAPLVAHIRSDIAALFINDTTTLTAFDLEPKKPRQPVSAEARLAATAKPRATRAARGTTSKKHKATISGNVTGVSITPVTMPGLAPSATTPTASSTAATTTPATATPPAAVAPTQTTTPLAIAPVVGSVVTTPTSVVTPCRAVLDDAGGEQRRDAGRGRHRPRVVP